MNDPLQWTIFSLMTAAWPYVTTGAIMIVDIIATAHVILNKRDARASVLWIGIIWLSPGIGALAYYLMGINRIRRRAYALRAAPFLSPALGYKRKTEVLKPLFSQEFDLPEHLRPLADYSEYIAKTPLTRGNAVAPLRGGKAARAAMLGAIEAAQTSVTLLTYIFDNDPMGRAFVAALSAARARGVEVRVLVDAVGSRYSFPSIETPLRRAKIPHALFMRTILPWRMTYMNLRNHRKIMVVDGRIGFTGGMNIRHAAVKTRGEGGALDDLHFRMEGPVVEHLQTAFCEDWAFCTNELLKGKKWFPPIAPAGSVLARGVTDGPDEDFESIQWVMLGVIHMARRLIRIVTPYFVPGSALIAALNVAAMSGVDVEILLPRRGNPRLVQWASNDLFGQLLHRGVRIYLTPPPFDHSKMMVVDDVWVLMGSSNWDARSLRLNFEFNVEAYDTALGEAVNAIFEEKRANARPVALEEMEARPLPVKLRDGLARLLTPYI